jgi:hypothetical protein
MSGVKASGIRMKDTFSKLHHNFSLDFDEEEEE